MLVFFCVCLVWPNNLVVLLDLHHMFVFLHFNLWLGMGWWPPPRPRPTLMLLVQCWIVTRAWTHASYWGPNVRTVLGENFRTLYIYIYICLFIYIWGEFTILPEAVTPTVSICIKQESGLVNGRRNADRLNGWRWLYGSRIKLDVYMRIKKGLCPDNYRKKTDLGYGGMLIYGGRFER